MQYVKRLESQLEVWELQPLTNAAYMGPLSIEVDPLSYVYRSIAQGEAIWDGSVPIPSN